MEKAKIIIIGAGSAGLMAAKELAGHYDVLVLEASPRTGGRIHSEQTDNFSRIIEAGAEFIHGHLPITFQLLKEAGIEYVPVKGEMYRKKKGDLKEQDEIIESWDKILKKMKAMPEDMTMYGFLQQYYPEEKNAAVRKQITSYAEGFDVADIKKVSVHALYKEWSQEDKQSFRIPTGYSSMIGFMQKKCEEAGARVLTNHPVKRIYWEKDKVTAYTEDGQRFDAQKVIVTVPLSVLSNATDETSIRFIPTLDNYIKAASQIGMGDVLKIIVEFDQPFWKKDIGFILSDEVFPVWWTQLPDTTPILTGWIGGPRVNNFTDDSNEEILEKALSSLAAVFEIPLEELKKRLQAAAIYNWESAYSYPTPETPVARKLLNQPILNTLFFAGEGLYDGDSQGTVEAGLASGSEAARKIMNYEL